MLTENLLKPEELLDSFDADEAVAALKDPLEEAVGEIARELAGQVRPGLWDQLPQVARDRVIRSAQNRAPEVVGNLLAQMRGDLSQVVDIQYLTVSTLVRNKAKLNRLMRETSGGAMAFVRRSGIWFGFGIGLVQMVAWGTIHNIWLLPIFGLITGFVSDYVALQMLFEPRRAKKVMGIKLHGVIHAQREEITRNYARILAADLFSPQILFDAVLTGPGSDRLFAMVQREVMTAVDSELGAVGAPVAKLAVGTRRYNELKETVAQRAVALIPATVPAIEEYAGATLDLESVLTEKLNQLTVEQFEGIMRPIFKDDEMLMVTVGAALGFLVGEVQLELVVKLGGA